MIRPSILLTACIVSSGCSRNKGVWDGVYTSAQAARGGDIYKSYCVDCHSVEVSGFNRRLIGKGFMDNWREDSLVSLFDKIKTSMPSDAPSTLSLQQYVDVLSFILQKNGFPEGQTELRTDVLVDIVLTGRKGPEPLPNGALVRTVGCLTEPAKSLWMLANAGPLVRTRTSRDLTPDEMKVFQKQRLGRDSVVLHTTLFRFFSRDSDLLSLINHKVVVTGRLVRKDSDIYIEIVRAKEIDPNCR